MKSLRQYIRQVLLTEAAMGVKDLPKDKVIVINRHSPTGAMIYYAAADDPLNQAQYDEPASGDINIYSLGKVSYGSCDGAWMVGGAFAQSGWGPLLYDVAIEWATENAGGLIADRSEVSSEAFQVWQYYMQNRGDVTAHQLDDEENTLTPKSEDNCDQNIAGGRGWESYDDHDYGMEWVKNPLSKRYTKPPTTMNALRNSGKLVIL